MLPYLHRLLFYDPLRSYDILKIFVSFLPIYFFRILRTNGRNHDVTKYFARKLKQINL
jgi:hypothetical protein